MRFFCSLWTLPALVLLILAPMISTTEVAATQEPTPVTVALDWYPNANHAGLFLAQERGAFAAAGLDVEPYTPSDPTVVLQTVGAGQDTFGISYQTDVLLARAQGVPVVSVAALVQRPLLGVMSLQEEGITRPRDLVGKTVGYPGIPSQEAFLATMLEADGASLDDVELVNIGFDLVPAVASGRVDAVMGAYWTHETILAEREGYPVDLRTYGLGAQILRDLGARRLRLLTNNPRKVVGLEGHGLEIAEWVPLVVPPGQHNRGYLDAKRQKLGHLLQADPPIEGSQLALG